MNEHTVGTDPGSRMVRTGAFDEVWTSLPSKDFVDESGSVLVEGYYLADEPSHVEVSVGAMWGSASTSVSPTVAREIASALLEAAEFAEGD